MTWRLFFILKFGKIKKYGSKNLILYFISQIAYTKINYKISTYNTNINNEILANKIRTIIVFLAGP